MLSKYFTLFVVALVLGMDISYSLAFAITLSAAIEHHVWQNTTNNLILASPPERVNDEHHPQTTLCSVHVPQTAQVKSVVPDRRATATQTTTSVSIATAPIKSTPKAPTPLATFRNWPSPNAANAHHATGHAGINLDTLMSTDPHSHTMNILPIANLGGDTARAFGNASIKQTDRQDAATSMSGTSLPTFATVASNSTASSHRPTTTNAKATTIIWTVPSCSTTTTPTPAPKTRDTAFRQFINNINSALPYLEACGLLVIVWNVGKFILAKIQKYRGIRPRLPVVEET